MPSYLFLKESRGGYNAGKTAFSYGQRNFLDIQMAAFIQAVFEQKKPDRNTIEDSMMLMQILDEIQRHMEEVPKVS